MLSQITSFSVLHHEVSFQIIYVIFSCVSLSLFVSSNFFYLFSRVVLLLLSITSLYAL